MRKGFLGSLAALLASSGLALAQSPEPSSNDSAPPAAQAAAEGEATPDLPNGPGSDPLAPAEPCHPQLSPLIPPRTTPPSYPEEVTEANKDDYPPYCSYGGIEYLHWWLRGAPCPPLLTTGSAASRGALGNLSTQVLIGNNTFTGLTQDGMRFTLGEWLDPTASVEASYFNLSQGTGTGVSSTGIPVLGRPFFNVLTGMQDAAGVALPGLVMGGVQVREDSRLWGAEGNYRTKIKCGEHFNLLGLLGLRYLELDEGLIINEQLSILPTVPVIGGLGALAQDTFGTRNHIYAGQIGAEAEWTKCRFFVNARAKLALGAADETATVAGLTTNTGVTPTTTVPGGLLALPTNNGHHSRTEFVVVPEVGINVGGIISEHWRASIGYNYMYISQMLRPGNQIDLGVNPAQGIPGSAGTGGPVIPPRPAFSFKESSYWAQGLTVSLEFRF
jgi:hypothetical protein